MHIKHPQGKHRHQRSSISHELSLAWKNAWQTKRGDSDVAISQTFSQKWMKWACHFKGNSCHYLWPIIKPELSSKNEKSGKHVAITGGQKLFHVYSVSDEMVVVITDRIFSTEQGEVLASARSAYLGEPLLLQMTNVWCYRITHGQETHPECKREHGFEFNSRGISPRLPDSTL